MTRTPMHQIEHVVVLMLENRSFDHLLGFLDHPDPTLRRLTGNEANVDKNGTVIRVSKAANGQIPYDPQHQHEHVCMQLTSGGPPLNPKKIAMNGFARDAAAPHDAVMKCFDPARLPVLSTLAREFVVCDRWFSSIPGQTWPNRHYAHAGHSARRVDNDVRPYGMPTIFDRLEQADASWRVYHTGLPQVASFWKLWIGFRKVHFFPMNSFDGHARNGTLPAYSFIEPRHEIFFTNSQHPGNNKKRNRDFLAGEELIRRVYTALADGPKWESTLLLITYDEHGGFYDHEHPVPVVSPHPGQRDRDGFDFGFELSGVRVPAVIVSPWTQRGEVDHTPYDHSSIPHSVRERFAPFTRELSPREEGSETFWHVLQEEKRQDPPGLPPRAVVNRLFQFVGEVADRFDRHDEPPEEDDIDMYQLARDVDELMAAEARSEREAEQLAAALEENERQPPPEVFRMTRGDIGRYVEEVGERFEQHAERARLAPPPAAPLPPLAAT